ncbi:MAG: DUF3050 domain-containing protein [Planctomycetota bacterium]|nr:MAG: DUF3050 domain-containing protein [Planctomycetota bacterium]
MDDLARRRLATLAAALAPARARVTRHPLFVALADLDDLRLYASRHVFAVWDFMSLLKRLQRDLTCVGLPWQAPADGAAARLVNEIVLAEESDDDGAGGHCSHYELYRRGMRELGADERPIERFQLALRELGDVERALDASEAPPACARFVRATWSVASRGALHEVAAVFALGREDIIPEMFRALLAEAERCAGGRFATLRHYLERHVHLDGDVHTPHALALLVRLGGDDARRWGEMRAAAERALDERAALWDGVLAELVDRRAPVRG